MMGAVQSVKEGGRGRRNARLVIYIIYMYCTVLYCIVLYCTVLYFTVLYCTVQVRLGPWVRLRRPGETWEEYNDYKYYQERGAALLLQEGTQEVLYCTVLYCTVLYCTVL